VVLYTLLITLGIIMLLPFVWMLSTALKPAGTTLQFPPTLYAGRLEWSNFAEAMTILPFHLFLRNTLIIAACTITGGLATASMAAYAFSRVRFAGRSFWFVLVLASMMLPGTVTMVPNYIVMTRIGWVNTFLPLIVPAVMGGGAFTIFILRQFFAGIPHELDEAARLDGAGHAWILLRVILPLSTPALASLAVLRFIGVWNEFIYAMIYLNSTEKKTLALGLRMLQEFHGTSQNMLMAASTAVLVPVIVLFFFTQKYFIRGLSITTGLSGR
jgi:multiple sugar transport system permease protein